jgi:hypothetical protein
MDDMAAANLVATIASDLLLFASIFRSQDG